MSNSVKIEDGVITAQKIVLQSPSGKTRIHLETTDDLAGLWISGASPSGHVLALFSDGRNTGIGVYGSDKTTCVLSLHLTENGAPCVQWFNPETGKHRILNLLTVDDKFVTPGLPECPEVQELP